MQVGALAAAPRVVAWGRGDRSSGSLGRCGGGARGEVRRR
jgi:hypothetical protein